MKKRLFIIALSVLLVFCLSGCQESNESKYNRAGKLLTEGKYEEAVKIFDEISTYEDSSKMAMYGKAIAAAENGEYTAAFASFKALGEYKDCPMMITYYTARQYESQATDTNWSPRILAAETYDTIALFLDSKDRAENCRRTVYDEAVRLAGQEQYVQSIEMLNAILDYEDCIELKRYYEAYALEQINMFSEASAVFEELGDYRDSKDQVSASLKRGYEKADALEQKGDQEAAYELFMSLGKYGDSFERANKPYYDLGVTKREASEWEEAVAAFKHAGNYVDAEEQILVTRYAEGEAKRAAQDWDGAVEAFGKAGEYNDSKMQISETRYQEASALEAVGDQEGAYKLFMSLGKYRDSFERANKPYYELGIAKREAGEWDAAVAAFEHAGDYSDSKTQISETRYQEASALEAAGNQEGAYKLFMSLDDYSNSFERANKPYYELGIAKREAGEWDAAVAAFEHAGEYSDAKEQIPATRYVEGLAKRDAQDWDGAVTAFGNAGEYNDAAEQVFVTYYTEGLTKRDAQDWDGAVTAFGNAGEYSDAAEQVLVTYYMEGMKKRETKDWDDAVTAFGNAGEYIDAPEQITETWYQKATDLETSGKYDDAYAMLKTIRGYRDVDSLLKNNENFVAIHEAMLEPFRSVGNVVTFGRYEQDNNTGNGPEEIEWIVLDYDEANHKALLLSRYGLEVMAYNKEYTDITWEKCTLRTWLNGEFLDKAFSAAEQSAILMTKLDNSKSQGYSKWNTDGGNNTEDRIFLLSYAEANRYLGVTNDDTSNLISRVAPTAYALAHGAWIDIYKTEEGAAAGTWWLRSPGSYQDNAAVVSLLGSLYDSSVDRDDLVVRPALWLNLESDIF